MRVARQDRKLWRRTRRIADGLALPSPFDPAVFVAGLAERRGRPIELLPITSRNSIPCGLLVTTDRADYILYAADTTALHRQHILLHEAAHLLWGHDKAGAPDSAASRVLTPSLSPSLVRRVLGRTVYSEPQEREAELLASLILHRAMRVDSAGGRAGPAHGRAGPLVGAPDGERIVRDGERVVRDGERVAERRHG